MLLVEAAVRVAAAVVAALLALAIAAIVFYGYKLASHLFRDDD